MEFTDKDIENFSNKLKKFYNSVVPKYLRNDNNINKDKEKSFIKWTNKIHNKLNEYFNKLKNKRRISNDNNSNIKR